MLYSSGLVFTLLSDFLYMSVTIYFCCLISLYHSCQISFTLSARFLLLLLSDFLCNLAASFLSYAAAWVLVSISLTFPPPHSPNHVAHCLDTAPVDEDVIG